MNKAAACLLVGLWLVACSSSGGGVAGPSGSIGGASNGGSGGSGFIEAGSDANTCPGGCDGGTCIQGTCCAAKNTCGNQCCSSGQICSFQNDGSPPHVWHECRTDNNTSAGASGACAQVH